MGKRWLRLAWEDVRQGSRHFHQRNVPLQLKPLGQFVHGLCLPFHLARILLADRQARRSYWRVCLTQAAVVLALGLLFTGSGREAVESGVAERELQEARRSARKAESARAEVSRLVAAGKVDAETEALLERAVAVSRRAERVAEAAARKERRVMRRVVFLAALFSTLQVVQWIVIALSRDFHDAFSLRTSQLAGVPPEDEPLTPRVRFNGAWLRNKLKRRWRGLVVFAMGVPLLWLVRFLPGGSYVFPVLLSVWGVWWAVVFTAAKSARAWGDASPREPWFLRGWSWLAARIPPLRWALPRAYVSAWTTFTRPVFSPVACVERQPWVFGGLAVARALAMLPLVKCFLRPFIPVASAHLLDARLGTTLPLPSVGAGPLPDPVSEAPPDDAPPAPGAVRAAATPDDR